MTLDEALNYSLTVSWTVEQCNKVDTDCVGVVPDTKILFRYPDATIDSELEIIPFGSIDPILAEHIVKLHNEKVSIEQDIKKLKEEFNKLYSNPNCSITVTQNPSLNDYRIIKRKEID